MIQEAGGIVTDIAGGSRFMESGSVLTANPKLHEIMSGLIAPHLTDGLRQRCTAGRHPEG
jgi:myo-inositol-1(or 4)-monophosphatase